MFICIPKYPFGSRELSRRKLMAPPHKSRENFSTLNHLVAGGLGGIVGAVITSPFDVIKTRLQSSGYSLQKVNYGLNLAGVNHNFTQSTSKPFSAVASYMRFMIKTEGWTSLYRGLELHLFGTAPSRAIYFAVYSNSKRFFSSQGNLTAESPLVPVASSMVAGFTTCTTTNPIWFLKTRLQLERSRYPGSNKGVLRTVHNIYMKEGWRKFYSGLSASYLGIVETVINFVIYEQVKLKITKLCNRDSTQSFYFSTFLVSSLLSKTTASIVGYPHEVLRTRLRQQSNDVLGKSRYNSFLQTILMIWKEEGWIGFYGGLWTHLLRQVPNTVILFLTYEAVIHNLEK